MSLKVVVFFFLVVIISFIFPEHMFESEDCLKADAVPGCILSANCLLVIGHYSRTERRAVQRAAVLVWKQS